jgi:uncharacterized protein YeaO (DUF488 family)
VLLVAELTSDRRANVRHHGISVETKRVYESASADDGYRVLIDRLWPRGLSRTDARVDAWARALVYAACDSEHSNAAVLAPIIRRGLPR